MIASKWTNHQKITIIITVTLSIIFVFIFYNQLYQKDKSGSAIKIFELPAVSRQGQKLPEDFPLHYFIVGCTKCASTTLFDLLQEHDEVCQTSNKEYHFFDHKNNYDLGPTALETLVSMSCKNQSSSKHAIDASPTYLVSKNVPIRMLEMFNTQDLPKKRFVIILRDPVARDYHKYTTGLVNCVRSMRSHMEDQQKKRPPNGWDSHLCGSCSRSLGCVGSNKKLFKKMVYGDELKYLKSYSSMISCDDDDEKAKEMNSNDVKKKENKTDQVTVSAVDRRLKSSLYYEQIQHWLQFFSRKQMLILSFDRFLSQPVDTGNRIASFLGLSHGFPQNTTLPDNRHVYIKNFLNEFNLTVDCQLRDALYDAIEPANQKLYKYLADSRRDGPKEEPEFPHFASSRCKTV